MSLAQDLEASAQRLLARLEQAEPKDSLVQLSLTHARALWSGMRAMSRLDSDYRAAHEQLPLYRRKKPKR